MFLDCAHFEVKARLIFFRQQMWGSSVVITHRSLCPRGLPREKKWSWVCGRAEQAEGQPAGRESPEVLELKEFYSAMPALSSAALIFSVELLVFPQMGQKTLSILFEEHMPECLHTVGRGRNQSHPPAPFRIFILVSGFLALFNPSTPFYLHFVLQRFCELSSAGDPHIF